MRILTVLLLTSAAFAQANEPKEKPKEDQVAELRAEVEKLKAQIADMQKSFQFEMAVCAGAIDGARKAHTAKQEAPKK